MINVTVSVVIEKPIAKIIPYATDQRYVSKWQKAVTSVEAPVDPLVKGSKFVQGRKFMGKEFKTTYEVLEMDPCFRFKSTGGPIGIEVDTCFESVGTGTRMTSNIQAEANGFFKVAEGLLARQLQAEMDEGFLVFKDLMEKM